VGTLGMTQWRKKMENKNVLAAVVLSTVIIMMWQFWYGEPVPQNQNQEQVQEQQLKGDKPLAPAITQKKIETKLTRSDAINEGDRLIIENKNIKGSISLTGALIDDLTLKNYNQENNSDTKKVILLNPKKYEQAYFLETGWATSGNEIVPDNQSKWSVKGNKVLSPNNPVTLEWENRNGLTFIKKFNIDDQYLITVNEEVKNTSTQTVSLFHYAQVTRQQKPDVQNFYILHEGLIGVVDESLNEVNYDDVQDKKKSYTGSKGWVGITDKYWLTAVVPEKGKNFNAEFVYDKAFKANYIITDPTVINVNQTGSNISSLFIGAKEVSIVDGYAENLGFHKFDLAIDWGWFHFFTKPLFFVIDYLFKLSGNFGIAIILLTAAIRLLFFPLANYSFASMAKMKALQPEMQRIKDLYKDDKQKIQMEMMSLYKKEKVNPVSGCLPILIQIPFFFAIYKMLFVTIEMRHAPFYGWIQDLSAPDPTSIFNFFGLIPWDPPSFLMIGAWPIIMGITMYVQQKLNPAPPDPIQAKIFAFFPLFLTVLLASFPSGLVIYWSINNVLTMAQQYVIIKKTKIKTA
jgi:YidC/Oxa1 family membrane protein insertase|tara:strand:- start:135 stop:1853 length:1719 start_codon:yes stop_codon:yes gene_type:complete